MTAVPTRAAARPEVRARAARVALGVVTAQPRRFALGSILWVTWWTVPALAGLVLQAFFDALSGERAAMADPAVLVGVLFAVEAVRLAVLPGAFAVWSRWWATAHALLRANLLDAQLASGDPGAGRPAGDAAAAIPVFRDDVEDVVELVDSCLDLAGAALFGVVAIAVMVAVDPLLTGVVVVPLVAVVAITRLLAVRVRRLRRAERESTAQVTGFLGGVFTAVLAVKVHGAEERAVARVRQLNAARRRTSLRDRLLSDIVDALSTSTADVTIGLVLLVIAGRMRGGAFTVGDLALFTSYLSWLVGLPRFVGIVLTRHRHAEVATRRMAALLPGEEPTAAVAPRPLDLGRTAPAPARPRPAPAAAPHLRLEGFGVVRPDGGGVRGVDLDLPPGSFTVVTGRVGAGKSTLLRGLLGLVGTTEGAVTWDGAPVTGLAAWMVPPRCAYVPQAPRLLSTSLRDNLALGVDRSPEDLHAALRRAALDADVAGMPEGLDTLLGPRGVRLSGGQAQRTAAARAFAARPGLLVCDDLSSALDAGTERRLWSRLLDGDGPRPTVVVVSHRAAALARADRVVTLDGGRVVDGA